MRSLLLFACMAAQLLAAQVPKSLLTILPDYDTLEEYEGKSIYLQHLFKKSSVIHEKSTIYNANIRYNIKEDIIEYKSLSGNQQLLQHKDVHVRIGEDYFYYCDFEDERGRKKLGYYVLVDFADQYRIYKKYELKVIKPKITNSKVLLAKGMVKHVVKYYLEEENTIVALPQTRKKMLAFFSDKASELKRFFKKEHIRLHKESDLMHCIAYYNALKSKENNQHNSLIEAYTQN